jgi:outer membrane protein
MMKQNKVIRCFLTIIFTCFLFTVYSQDKWSLGKCINYALENNIQVKQQELDTRMRGNMLLQSKLDLLPSLNGSYGQSYSSGRALDQTTYEFQENQTIVSGNLNANASLSLFNGLQKVQTIRENRLNLMASLKDLEKFKNDISLNIAASYLQIILNSELLNAARNQSDITLQQVVRTEKLVNAGSLPKANLLEIQAQAAAEELQVVNARNQLDIAYLNLTQLLELESVTGFEIEIPEIEIPEDEEVLGNVDETFKLSQDILPQIKSAEYKLQSAQAGLNVARGSRSPQISLSGFYYTSFSDARQRTTMNYEPTVIGQTAGGEVVTGLMPVASYDDYPVGDQLTDNVYKSLSFNISVPIFNGWYVNNSISNAKISILNQQYQLQYSKNLLYKEIQQAYADAKAALKKYKASEKALLAMEESFSYTKQRFEVGLVNTVDYNAAKNQLANTRSDLLQSKYEYIFKIKILDFYQGKPISLTVI